MSGGPADEDRPAADREVPLDSPADVRCDSTRIVDVHVLKVRGCQTVEDRRDAAIKIHRAGAVKSCVERQCLQAGSSKRNRAVAGQSTRIQKVSVEGATGASSVIRSGEIHRPLDDDVACCGITARNTQSVERRGAAQVFGRTRKSD